MQDDNTYTLYRAYNPAYPRLESPSLQRIWLTEDVDYAQLYLQEKYVLAEITLSNPLLIAYPCEIDSLLGYEFDPIDPTDEECAVIRRHGYDAFECESAGGDVMICLLNTDKIKNTIIQ